MLTPNKAGPEQTIINALRGIVGITLPIAASKVLLAANPANHQQLNSAWDAVCKLLPRGERRPLKEGQHERVISALKRFSEGPSKYGELIQGRLQVSPGSIAAIYAMHRNRSDAKEVGVFIRECVHEAKRLGGKPILWLEQHVPLMLPWDYVSFVDKIGPLPEQFNAALETYFLTGWSAGNPDPATFFKSFYSAIIGMSAKDKISTGALKTDRLNQKESHGFFAELNQQALALQQELGIEVRVEEPSMHSYYLTMRHTAALYLSKLRLCNGNIEDARSMFGLHAQSSLSAVKSRDVDFCKAIAAIHASVAGATSIFTRGHHMWLISRVKSGRFP